MIPKLFGTITVNIGKPIHIDSKLHGESFEQKRKEIENIMIKQLRNMDTEFDLPEIEYGLNDPEYKKHNRNK